MTEHAVEEATTGPIDKIKQYVELRDRQAASEAEAAGYKAEADKIEAELIEYFHEHDMQNTKIGGRTVYLHSSSFAQRKEGATAEDVIRALRAAGQDHLVGVTVNANTLSAYVRQLDKADEPLPEPLAAVVELGHRQALRVRK